MRWRSSLMSLLCGGACARALRACRILPARSRAWRSNALARAILPPFAAGLLSRGKSPVLAGARPLPQELAQAAEAIGAVDPSLQLRLQKALAETLPLSRQDGGFIRSGFD